MKLETVVLEDNQQYAILDTIQIKGVKYIYLNCIEDTEKPQVCIRKLSDNEEEILGLENEEEYNIALKTYTDKYKDLFES